MKLLSVLLVSHVVLSALNGVIGGDLSALNGVTGGDIMSGPGGDIMSGPIGLSGYSSFPSQSPNLDDILNDDLATTIAESFFNATASFLDGKPSTSNSHFLNLFPACQTVDGVANSCNANATITFDIGNGHTRAITFPGTARCILDHCLPTLLVPRLQCSDCQDGQVCRTGVCVPKPPSEGAVCTEMCSQNAKCQDGKCVLMPSFNINMDSLIQANFEGGSMGQQMHLSENKKFTLNMTDSFNGDFTFGNASSSYSDDGNVKAGVVIKDHVRINFQAVKAFTSAAFQLGEAAFLNISQGLEVDSNRTCGFVFSSASAVARAEHLVLEGALKLQGAGRFEFPSDASHLSIGAQASAIVSQGVSLTGNSGNLTINIDSSSNVSDARTVNIPAGYYFTSAGAVITTSLAGDAQLAIAGEFHSTGNQVDVKIAVAASGKVVINTAPYKTSDGTTTTTQFNGGDLSLAGTGAVIELHGNGANTYFSNFLDCVSGATINYFISTTFAATPSGIILNFDSSTDTSALKCAITVTDSTGAVIHISNPNVATSSASASRRLLSSSQATGSWGQSTLSYSANSQSAASTISTVAAAAASVAAALTVFFF